jgi:type IV pilus assembly protein PilY1
MSYRILRALALAALGLFCVLLGTAARAADTDVFANPNSGYNAPNVLFVLDTGASFSASNSLFRCGIDASGNVLTTDGTVITSGSNKNATALDQTNGGVEQCALYSVIKSIATGTTTTVNIGVMMFNSQQKTFHPSTTGASTGTFALECAAGGGGCLALPMTQLNTMTAPSILNWVKGWVTSGNSDYLIKSPADRGDGATMQEAWAYFTGHTGISGRAYSAPNSPCGNNYVVFVGNAYNTQASPKDTTNSASSPLMALNGTFPVSGARASPAATADQILKIADTRNFSCGASRNLSGTLTGDEGKGGYALNWAQYMSAQGIKTYTVGITGDSCDRTYVAQLDKMGSTEIGGGKYFNTTNFQELVDALKILLGEIQSVNSVFAAVSLPVSVNTQGSYLNQVFVGMFRPQKNFLPMWTGNLKQYRLGMVGGVLRLLDANTTDTPAINSLTGFITECARSYWTPGAVDDYWSLEPSGGCLKVENSKISNYPDGNIVEKGAQAYMLRSGVPANRVVYTCNPSFGSCGSLTNFNTGNSDITTTLLGAASTTERDNLINWARGTNVEDELNKGTSAFRPSAHGDIVHSRPIPVNHGTDGAPNIVVYYGGNDGMLRAVNGNRTATFTVSGTTYAAGQELWSFLPPQFYGKIKRLHDNTQPISFPSSNVATATEKDYGVDGPITAFQGSIGGSDKTYIYATMRRGGRTIYAFDVTNPGSPSLKWKAGCPNAANDTDCSSNYSQIGQTWSALKTMYAYGYDSGNSPLLIAGGGYDSCEDYDAKVTGGKNHNCAVSTTKGNRIYVIDAQNGTRIKSFQTDRAVVAEVTLVRDVNGKVLYGYTADLGGNVYRLTFPTTVASDDSSHWTITKIASLGCATPAACTDAVQNRKFMFAPSVATPDTIGSTGATYYIAIGSGDREKPVKEYLASRSVQNDFFLIKDSPTTATWLSEESSNCGGVSVICMNSLYAITGTTPPTEAQLNTKPKGWALQLEADEQVVTAAVTIFGVVTFSTHKPALSSADACKTDLGTTRVYNISYLNAAGIKQSDSRFEDVAGDGLPPSPVAGRVTLDDGTTVPFCIGCSKDSPLEGAPPLTLSTVKQPTGRLYWYKER